MNILDRYMGKAILQTIAIVLFAMAGIEIFIMMIGEFGDIGHNHYTIFSALFYVLLNLPDQIYQFFPMVGLIGMLMAFGLLASHSELVVMQSVGLSPLHITLSALKTIILLLIMVSIVGELIAPKASAYANYYKTQQLKSNLNTDDIASNLWLRMGNNFLHVQRVDKKNILHNINWYIFNDQQQLLQANKANDAEFQNRQWFAHHIAKTVFSESNTQIFSTSQEILPFNITPTLLLQSTQSTHDLSLNALHQSLQFGKANHLQNDSHILSFWRRILQPFASLVMMLLAIPFVFGPLRQASNSLRLVIGIAVGFCFYYLNAFFGPVVLLFHWPPMLGALLPTIIFGALGVLLLRLQKQ
jgi:lipopolysaccharide export system permease protein